MHYNLNIRDRNVHEIQNLQNRYVVLITTKYERTNAQIKYMDGISSEEDRDEISSRAKNVKNYHVSRILTTHTA